MAWWLVSCWRSDLTSALDDDRSYLSIQSWGGNGFQGSAVDLWEERWGVSYRRMFPVWASPSSASTGGTAARKGKTKIPGSRGHPVLLLQMGQLYQSWQLSDRPVFRDLQWWRPLCFQAIYFFHIPFCEIFFLICTLNVLCTNNLFDIQKKKIIPSFLS